MKTKSKGKTAVTKKARGGHTGKARPAKKMTPAQALERRKRDSAAIQGKPQQPYSDAQIAAQALKAAKEAGVKVKDILSLPMHKINKLEDNDAFKRQREMLHANEQWRHAREEAPVVTKASVSEASTQEVIDTMLGTPSGAPLGTQVGIVHGVYQTRNRSSAIVVGTTRTKVMFLTFMDGTVEHKTMEQRDFARDFCFALPSYPVRRAARIYLNSFLGKTEKAERILRSLLAS